MKLYRTIAAGALCIGGFIFGGAGMPVFAGVDTSAVSAASCVSPGDTVVGKERLRFAWDIDFRTVFDNRECDDRYTPNETFFFTQLTPAVGLRMDGGRHSLMGGVVWTQPIGCDWEGHRIIPELYYMYRGRRWNFAFGMLPRKSLIRPLPGYIESDSARYFQPVVRGALLQHRGRGWFFESLIDWRGMQSDVRREAFCVIAQGEWEPGRRPWRAGGLVMMNHLARTRMATADQHVIDNFIVNPYVGAELGRYVAPLDSLALRVGMLASMTRDRGESVWRNSAGLWLDVSAAWWRLSLANTLWLGSKPLFPLYERYGMALNDGEPYYAGRYYNRTTLMGRIIDWRGIVQLDAALDFHLAPGNFSFYQRLMLSVSVGK